ncbi:unnamed protein product, partial [Arabidopsis halleri]
MVFLVSSCKANLLWGCKVLDLRLFWLKFWWIGFEILVRGSLVLLIVVFGSFLRGFP